MTPPTIGRIVHYRLCEQDAERINEQRDARHTTGTYVACNGVAPGFVYPAIVVRTADNTLAVNLQVFLDGPDTLWVTSRGSDEDEDGCWFWPPRIDMTREGR
jgi:hypothetical protein